METRLMNVLRSALRNGWDQCCDALHPAPHPTLLEALRATYLVAAHTVTQFTQDAERMEYPHFRAWLPLKKLEGVVKALQGWVQYGQWHKRRCSRQRSIHGE